MSNVILKRITTLGVYYLKKRPFVTNSVFYGTIYALAEWSQQVLKRKILSNEKTNLDWIHLSHMGAFGYCIQGPALAMWYYFIDKKYSEQSPTIAVKKVLMSQFLFALFLYMSFFIFLSILEGQEDIFKEMLVKFPATYVISLAFWMPAGYFIFSVIPSTYRVISSALFALVWANILCFIKSYEVL